VRQGHPGADRHPDNFPGFSTALSLCKNCHAGK
jgi:hypothetical protein